MAKETREFQAETQELLNLMINSIYTNKEIFLRELISNASDAIDKVHFASLTNSSILGDDTEYQIFLIPDKNSHTLTISDNGIGMSREEVINNIGTIAKSGTKAFLEQLKQSKEDGNITEDMIGQFGVGFYSAFMVADKVVILTKKAGEDTATRWESAADGSYTVEDAEKESRGASIILTLKEEFYKEDAELDLTDNHTLQNLVKKYSDYVRYPIKMNFTVEETPKDENGNEIKDAKKIEKTELRTLNSMEPLWTKNKNDVKEEEYNEFFKQQFYEWEAPMEIFHTKAEGNVTYTTLLAIPAHAPFDLYHTNYEPGISLYSRHVFIMDKCKDLLPDYLGFIKGLVDSPDFSLNISRELLQKSSELKNIGKAIEKNILKSLERKLKNDRDAYERFWLEYGKSFKIGMYNSRFTDFTVTDKLKNLLLFKSSKEGKYVSLKEYVERMPESQKKIYYATAKDEATIEKLPQMELMREKGLEVLYLLDPIDEFAIEAMMEYEGKSFNSISQGDLELDDAESQEVKKETKEIQKSNDKLLKDIKKVLGDKVETVKISTRLKSGAVCLVAAKEGPSLSMEQTFAQMDNHMFKARRILEINPHHELFDKLKAMYEEGGKDNENFKDYCDLLYTQALIIEGILPDNPVDFANKVAKLMAK